MNGALWTIKIEVMFYAIVPVLAGLAKRHGRLTVLGAAYLVGIVWMLGFSALAARTGSSLLARLSYQLPGSLGYFASGALCYYYLAALQKRRAWVATLGALGLVVAGIFPDTQIIVEPAAIALVVTFLALGVPPLGNFARHGDMSYGVYILHVPVLQTLIAIGIFTHNPYGGLALAIALILALAFACWHLVEKPFLQRSSHYVLASRGA